MIRFFRRMRHLRRTPRLVVLGVVAALALGAALPLTALAAPITAATHSTTCDLSCIQQFGNARIAERITALNSLSGKVQTALGNKRITSDQANALTSDAGTNETGLNNLKTKLDGETSADAARQDVKNIYLQFRIYAVVLPRDYRTLYLDAIVNVHDRLVDLEGTIQDAITKAGNPAPVVTLFDDYKNQLQAVESQIDAANGELPQLTPENYNNNHAAYETALTNLKNDEQTAHSDLKQAVSDLHQIVQTLKGGSTASGTAVPSPTSPPSQ